MTVETDLEVEVRVNTLQRNSVFGIYEVTEGIEARDTISLTDLCKDNDTPTDIKRKIEAHCATRRDRRLNRDKYLSRVFSIDMEVTTDNWSGQIRVTDIDEEVMKYRYSVEEKGSTDGEKFSGELTYPFSEVVSLFDFISLQGFTGAAWAEIRSRIGCAITAAKLGPSTRSLKQRRIDEFLQGKQRYPTMEPMPGNIMNVPIFLFRRNDHQQSA